MLGIAARATRWLDRFERLDCFSRACDLLRLDPVPNMLDGAGSRKLVFFEEEMRTICDDYEFDDRMGRRRLGKSDNKTLNLGVLILNEVGVARKQD